MNESLRIRIFDKEIGQYVDPVDTDYYIDPVGRVILVIESIAESGVVELKSIDISEENDLYAVERCTGLRDKNGRLIYEGDKIRFEDANAEGVIVFCKGAFCYKWEVATVLLHHIAEDVTGRIDNHDLVIIGNIHEEEE